MGIQPASAGTQLHVRCTPHLLVLWRSILSLKEHRIRGIRWIINQTTSIWSFWLPSGPLDQELFPAMSVSSEIVTVSRPSSPGRRDTRALKFIRPAQMSLFARITCYPPLGEVTCVKRLQKANSTAEDKVRHAAFSFIFGEAWLTLWLYCCIYRFALLSFCHRAHLSPNKIGTLRFGTTFQTTSRGLPCR